MSKNLSNTEQLLKCVDACCNYFPYINIGENILIRCEHCNNQVYIKGKGQFKEKDAMVAWNKMIRKQNGKIK